MYFRRCCNPNSQCHLRNAIYQSVIQRVADKDTNFNSDSPESPIILLVRWDLDYFMIVPDNHVAVRESWVRSDHCAKLTPGGRWRRRFDDLSMATLPITGRIERSENELRGRSV